MLGVLIHVIGDAINNIAVMASAAVIWWGKSNSRFYADPAVSTGISLMIFATSIPLSKFYFTHASYKLYSYLLSILTPVPVMSSGKILLESAPSGVDVAEVRKDLEELPGIASVHELHVWRLDQQKTIASVHVLTERVSVDGFMEQAQQIGECLHAYGVHSFTVQPERTGAQSNVTGPNAGATTGRSSEYGDEIDNAEASNGLTCRIKCQEGVCEEPPCCD